MSRQQGLRLPICRQHALNLGGGPAAQQAALHPRIEVGVIVRGLPVRRRGGVAAGR